ncbi:ParB N-terminal domain-containing protein [Brucella sp. IR073]|uniref:ParB N-terminal domain-containing protein n=1 Tax=unclassified Brucella TaxID=2632610 RepID=UPI003B986649
MDYCLVSPNRLIPTEEVDSERVDALQKSILQAGCWTVPIAVEKDALFVMDGHHRLAVAHRLGLAALPVILLDYNTVRVEGWRLGEVITPAIIYAMVRSGGKFPIKTTRHIFGNALPACDLPLALLHGAVPLRAVGS